MTQRKTQTAAYWQNQFTVSQTDLEFIYNQILETNSLFMLDELAVALVKRHCDAEELETRSELQRGKLYQPQDSYDIGDKIVFPKLDFMLGKVEATRPGYHPKHGKFRVLEMSLENSQGTREFVADFAHPEVLNIGDAQSLANLQGLLSPDELFETYRDSIQLKLKEVLDSNSDFVEFHGQYFLQDLLVEFHEGLFNIADAAIDINSKPLSVDGLIEQMGLAGGEEITDLLRFSVSYRLAEDERFDDVGPTGQVLWYLERLEPPEAHHTPRRLQAGDQLYDSSEFDEELWALLAEIDDEMTDPQDISPVATDTKSVTIVLGYPHWRVGVLPLTPKTLSFFPISHYNPVLFEFVDGRTGDSFPGWTVLNGKYVFGLDKWYQKNKLPVGAYIKIKRSDDPMRVIIDYSATRMQRDWVREVGVGNHQLTFRMNIQPISCKYDELMIISDPAPTNIDRLWIDAEKKDLSLYHILCQLFPELAKLNPQSTVHVKTLYSAVNVIRRFAPGVIFQELGRYPCFIPMNHGYYTFDPSLKD